MSISPEDGYKLGYERACELARERRERLGGLGGFNEGSCAADRRGIVYCHFHTTIPCRDNIAVIINAFKANIEYRWNVNYEEIYLHLYFMCTFCADFMYNGICSRSKYC